MKSDWIRQGKISQTIQLPHVQENKANDIFVLSECFNTLSMLTAKNFYGDLGNMLMEIGLLSD